MSSLFMKAYFLLAGPSVASNRLTDVGLLILRLWAGGVMALAHGLPKLSKLGESPIQFADPIGLGPTLSLVGTVLTELVGGILLALGLLTRAAAAGLLFTFIVVVFVVKFSEGFSGMELGASFLTLYLVLLLTGPGRLSLDHVLLNRRRSSAD